MDGNGQDDDTAKPATAHVGMAVSLDLDISKNKTSIRHRYKIISIL